MQDVNHTIDSRRLARDQEARLAASANSFFYFAKPFVQYQSAILRQFSDYCELIVRNVDKGLDAIVASTSADQPDQQNQQQRGQHG
jgi:hypothetical protein